MDLRFIVRAPTSQRARQHCTALDRMVNRYAARYVYGHDDDTLPLALGRLLLSRNETMATAESCTGGLIGKLMTDTPGSSAWYHGGVVSYDNRYKERLLGVSPRLITRYGAVSPPVARAMALGIARRTGAVLAVAVTGVAGPGGGSPEKPVGLVYLACAYRGNLFVERRQYGLDRETNRERAAAGALSLAWQVVSSGAPFSSSELPPG